MKRMFDLIVVLMSMPVLFLLLFFTTVIVKLKLGSPILFKQSRPGLNGRTFEMLKFRTMTNAFDNNGVLLSDTDRVTPFGQFLRSTSLDELPSIWSVVKGDMSLVGPRPLLLEYLPLYTEKQYRRHEVKPGITGWAQVNGRNAINWEEKFELDVWYVDKRSIWLDIRILLLTVKKVIIRDGVSAQNHINMPVFRGSK